MDAGRFEGNLSRLIPLLHAVEQSPTSRVFGAAAIT
jgi:hypothetical protein